MTPYSPSPGSYASKAVAVLRGLEPGQSMGGADLAQRLGIPYPMVSGMLQVPISRGWISTTRDGRRNRYTLGPKATEPAPASPPAAPPAETPTTRADDDDDPAPMRQIVRPAVECERAVTSFAGASAFHFADALAAELASRSANHPTTEPETPACSDSHMPAAGGHMPPAIQQRRIANAHAQAMRIALWSDGELVIERGGEWISFTEDETRQLVGYLERMAEGTAT